MDASERTVTIGNVTLVGALINVALSTAKVLAGVYGHSQAVVADGVHSLSDLATDVAVIIGVRYWSEPADGDHPYGHGRIETLITTVIGVTLFVVGVFIGYRAFIGLSINDEFAPSWIAFWAAIASVVLKEWLYRWTIGVGRRIRSQALIANAWHHRSDAFSSVPAVIAVATAILKPSFAKADHLGAMIVSGFIIAASWKIVSPCLQQLIDRGATLEDLSRIHQFASEIHGVRSVHGLRTRYIGSSLAVDLHVLVDGDATVRTGHDIAREVEENLLERMPEVLDVVVHIEPDDHTSSSESQQR